MKQVFYSEELNKYFDDQDSCQKAEDELLLKKTKMAEASNALSRAKKQAAKEIEEADSKVNLAYSDYMSANEKVSEMYKKVKQEGNQIISEAAQNLRNARKNKLTKIEEFNKKYGVYTVQYTGNEANNEFARTTSWINSLLNFFE